GQAQCGDRTAVVHGGFSRDLQGHDHRHDPRQATPSARHGDRRERQVLDQGGRQEDHQGDPQPQGSPRARRLGLAQAPRDAHGPPRRQEGRRQDRDLRSQAIPHQDSRGRADSTCSTLSPHLSTHSSSMITRSYPRMIAMAVAFALLATLLAGTGRASAAVTSSNVTSPADGSYFQNNNNNLADP